MSLTPFLLGALLLLAAQTGPLPRSLSDNQCAACHLRLAWTASRTMHVDEWVTSKHAQFGVGCEKCHGGDATASEAAAAHRDVRNSADPSSPVNRMALAGLTCAACHAPEANAFAMSEHRRLVASGDALAPTCTSCHSSMAADVPSPATLETQCLQCHHGDPQNRARIARREVEDIVAIRRILARAKLEIAGIVDRDRRDRLALHWTSASLSLRAVVAGIHSFDQRKVDDRLSQSHAQIDRLLADLGHPPR